MSKKNKSIRVKLIANPGAGKAAESAKNLKLVIAILGEIGFKGRCRFSQAKRKGYTDRQTSC